MIHSNSNISCLFLSFIAAAYEILFFSCRRFLKNMAKPNIHQRKKNAIHHSFSRIFFFREAIKSIFPFEAALESESEIMNLYMQLLWFVCFHYSISIISISLPVNQFVLCIMQANALPLAIIFSFNISHYVSCESMGLGVASITFDFTLNIPDFDEKKGHLRGFYWTFFYLNRWTIPVISINVMQWFTF